MKYTKKEITRAFELWVKDARLSPETFMSEEKTRELSYKEEAKRDAEYLISLIKYDRQQS
jgi:hypothetical protein